MKYFREVSYSGQVTFSTGTIDDKGNIHHIDYIGGYILRDQRGKIDDPSVGLGRVEISKERYERGN